MSIEAEAINESEPAAVRKVYLIPFSQAIRIKDIPEGINGDAYSIALSWDGDVEGEPAWCTHETLEGLRALGLEPEIEGERRILPVFHGSMRWIETVNYEEILSCLAYAKYDEDVSGIVYVGCNCERDVWQRGLPELKDSFFYYSQNEMRPYIWLAVTSDLTARFAYSLYHQDDNLAAWLEEIGYIDL
ncbi:MAG: hypothetical protein KBA97_12230, partial [Methanothrix sp.]|nr:hypothetical protein [Methanothrix sp.]